LTAKTYRWQVVAAALASFSALWTGDALALSLGRLAVHSALGEPLRAEIEVTSVSREEAASLKAQVAGPDAFQTAGLDYNAMLIGLRVAVQMSVDGRVYLHLNSVNPVNEPFVDLILEVNWSSGKIVRDYTMLFDPPNLRSPKPVETVSVQRGTPGVSRSHATQQKRVLPRPDTVTVKRGDTAGNIAVAAKVPGVTLDQMLVAMVRSNPAAFIANNVNRIKAGAVLSLPSEAKALDTAPNEATQIVMAQNSDFAAYRQKLAQNIPSTPTTLPTRQLRGKVSIAVAEKKPSVPTPDKLTLSRGSVKAAGHEDKLAESYAVAQSSRRAAELTKNIKDLNQLMAAASAPVAASSPVSPTSSHGLHLATPAVSIPSPVVHQPSVSSPSKPVASSPRKSASVASAPSPELLPEPGWLDALMTSPLILAAGAAVIALLVALGIYKVRQRKSTDLPDSMFLESRMQPDSYFGGSGGQRIDTNDGPDTGSSMVYSSSQLDAVEDVDPVAEADVYLAYGRDIQAEEILKDALRSQPERLAIHKKLLEVYAKRRDTKAFEAIATLAFNLTGGTGADWNTVCKSGLTLEPDNVLYQPGGQPNTSEVSSTLSQGDTVTEGLDTATSTEPAVPTTSPDNDLDLDLDFSLDDPEPPNTLPAPLMPSAGYETPQDVGLPSIEPVKEPTALPPVTPPEVDLTTESMFAMPNFSFNVDDTVAMNAPPPQTRVPPPPPPTPPPAADTGMLEFDLGSLSLDFEDEQLSSHDEGQTSAADPLETKLALAEEFKAIGDLDGARALIEEVIEGATGDMKVKAQRALSAL
jgi:pilus assembly protein FimV